MKHRYIVDEYESVIMLFVHLQDIPLPSLLKTAIWPTRCVTTFTFGFGRLLSGEDALWNLQTSRHDRDSLLASGAHLGYDGHGLSGQQ